MAPPLLEVESITVFHGSVRALREVSLHVNQGEMVALLGANGAGKSTTLRAVAGTLAPASGTVRVAGHLTQHKSSYDVARAGVVYVAEGRELVQRPPVPDPRLLLVDELSRGLAPAVVAQVVDVLREYQAAGAAVVLAERDASIALASTDRAYVLRNGEVVMQGRSGELLADAALVASALAETAAASTS